LVRQATKKTNNFVGDGTTTSVVLPKGLISEGVRVIFATSIGLRFVGFYGVCFLSFGLGFIELKIVFE